MKFFELNKDIIEVIFYFIDLKNMINLIKINKSFHKLSNKIIDFYNITNEYKKISQIKYSTNIHN
jgi:hypothetical protein